MLESMVSAMFMMFQPVSLLALLIGVLFGLISGALPGGSLPGLVIILSFAYSLDPSIIIPMAIGATAVISSSDTIPAVLLGVPGSATGQATILDGYQMAKQGRAGEALGAAYAASLIGGLFGTLALFITIPFARSLISVFAAPEFMMMSLLGIAIVGVLSSGAMMKGIMAGLFGLGISIIGFDTISGFARSTFGMTYFWDGISIIPVILGLFALPEMIDMIVQNTSIARVSVKDMSREINKGLIPGILTAMRHKFLILRSSLLGAFVGFMPGLGVHSGPYDRERSKGNFREGRCQRGNRTGGVQ
jgi:putative tricarboxylic transport membrane protein